MEKTIMVNLLLIKNTLFQLPGPRHTPLEEGAQSSSQQNLPCKVMRGSKKTPLAALREARLGAIPVVRAPAVSWRTLC